MNKAELFALINSTRSRPISPEKFQNVPQVLSPDQVRDYLLLFSTQYQQARFYVD